MLGGKCSYLSIPGESGEVDLDVSEFRKMMIPRRATLKKKVLGNPTPGLANYGCYTRRLRDTGARVKAFRTYMPQGTYHEGKESGAVQLFLDLL